MPPRPDSLQVPARPASLEAVRRFVALRAAEAGLGERAVEQVKLAVDEACANVVEHAYGGEEGHTISVRIEADEARLVVRIRHTGRGFEPDRYHGPLALADAAIQRRKGGFGVQIMQRLMDEVAYSTRGRVSEVRLTKYRPAVG